MRTLAFLIVVLGGLVGGCTGSATATGSTRVEASGSPAGSNAVVEPDAPSPAPSATHFWVVDDTLVAYDLDGTRVASLGDEPLDRAHRLADGRVVGLIEGDQHALVLVILDAGGARTQRIEVANFFDPEQCNVGTAPSDPSSYTEPLRIQDPRDFGVNAGAACLTLQDRNVNMASYELSVTVDLATGGLLSRVALDLDGECEGKQLRRGIVEGSCEARADSQPWVVTVTDEPPAREDWPARFDEATRSLVRAGQEPVRLCIPGHVSADPDGDWGACAELESSSTSGRWSLLSGNRDEGDYIYRDLLLLDHSDGTLLQIGEPRKFVEVTPAQVFADEPEQGRLWLVAESEVAWLPGDRLWVDGLLLIPERREIVELGGTLARTRD
jgi:hypothetical protein